MERVTYAARPIVLVPHVRYLGAVCGVEWRIQPRGCGVLEEIAEECFISLKTVCRYLCACVVCVCRIPIHWLLVEGGGSADDCPGAAIDEHIAVHRTDARKVTLQNCKQN